MAKMWMRVPTPVTTSAISADSGSHCSSKVAPIAGIHSQITRCSVSPVPAKKGMAAPAATAKDPAMARVASHPGSGSRMNLPRKCRATDPARGRAMTSQRKSLMRPSSLQLRQLVDRGGFAVAEDRHDDRQSDDDLGRGDDQDE